MATWIKWWKNKNIVIMMCIMFGAVGLSALFAQILAYPWNLITVILICIPSGITARKLITKEIDKLMERLEQENESN